MLLEFSDKRTATVRPARPQPTTTWVYCFALATLTSVVTEEDARAHSSSMMGAPLEVEARMMAVAEAARDRSCARMVMLPTTEEVKVEEWGRDGKLE